MKHKSLLLIAVFIISVSQLFAGNEQRAGQAGAGELLINPWARSSGWGGANVACITGLEAQFNNVAGTAFTRKTELIFANTQLLMNTGIQLNTFGLSQRVSETGVLTLSVISMNLGEIEKTNYESPEGGLGTFNPQYTNIGVSYAKEFSNSIYGGVTIKILNEKISNLSSPGVAIDAGIQYVTGKNDQLKFGITMKNVGPTMKFSGDGMSLRGETPEGVVMTMENRSNEFEMPSLIKIGASYDFILSENHLITTAANFTSNSFTKDQYHGGIEYSFNEIFMIRGGYVYEEGLLEEAERTTAYTGPTGGVSVQFPLNKETGTTFSLDYSYRDTDPFEGTHTFGARISL